MKLIVKLIAGILLGIIIGAFAPEAVARVLYTLKTLIGELIGFTIPLIILFYICSGIAGLPRGANHLLGKTVGFAYGSTVIAGTWQPW